MDTTVLSLAKKYTDDSLEGVGAIAGKPCQIESIEPITGGNKVTYLWEDNSGTEHTQSMNVMNGQKGDTGERGEVGETGATGEAGRTATIAVGTVVSGDSPAVTNVGTQNDGVFNFVLPKGDKGDRGEKGNDGADGKSFDIKAQYPTYAALIAAHPTGEAGDAYFVGTDENPDLYIWLTDDNEWFNNGKIAGVKGDKGEQGEEGFSPVASVSKVGKVATITIRDKVGQTTATVSDGEDGEDAQFEELPTASATNEGKICQYIGATSGSLVNGHFYQCVNQSGTFVWVEKFGSAMEKNATDRVQPNSHDLVESGSVYSAINSALSSIYTARGDLTCAELTSSLLISDNVGDVYEMTDAGTTSNLFLQGAGQPIAIGDNVGIINAGEGRILYNLMANAFDLTAYQKQDLASAVEGETTVEGALGALSSGKVSTALVPSDASASNKLVTANGKVDRISTTHWISDDFNNAVPTDGASFEVFTVLNSALHTPKTGANYIVTAIAFQSGIIQQEAVQNGTNNRYIRYLDNGTWSSWQKLVTESEFKSYGIKTIWTGSKTKGDTGMNFDASPYDLCFAQVGGTLCMLISGMGGGTSTRKKFTTVYAGRDLASGGTYEQYYLLDILGDGTVATCGWFDIASKDTQNSRLAGQKALELALAGTSTWTDPTWKKLADVETNVTVSKIIGIKFQTKS